MMKIYARIQDGAVAELFQTDGDITKMFHPDLVWVEADPDVLVGDAYDGRSFSRPPNPEPLPSQPPRFTALEMLDLFTEAEQLAVVEATMSVPAVKLWYDRMIAASFVTYEDPRTEGGLQALVDAELLTPARKAEIVAAMQPPEAE